VKTVADLLTGWLRDAATAMRRRCASPKSIRVAINEEHVDHREPGAREIALFPDDGRARSRLCSHLPLKPMTLVG
jgi:molybdopterin synthase sulfur carrier subunit